MTDRIFNGLWKIPYEPAETENFSILKFIPLKTCKNAPFLQKNLQKCAHLQKTCKKLVTCTALAGPPKNLQC